MFVFLFVAMLFVVTYLCRAHDAMLRMFPMFMFICVARRIAVGVLLWRSMCRRAHDADVFCVWLFVCVLLCATWRRCGPCWCLRAAVDGCN